MVCDEKLAERIRTRLAMLSNVEEKKMMGGITFMYNDKMCVGVYKDNLMRQIDPEQHEQAIKRPGCKTMDFTSRPMIGFVLIDDPGMKTQKEFDFWIGMALEFNSRAKSGKRKK
ncbi:MAG: TfoX/Sxy family protein [Bacteroidia bacterium]|nr:TfoX/Sxy family protein [Bacteroidota bacterium]MBK8875387.1 TfoX/Sxy family protein [Bacteroidota bacterium]MBK9047911.1 TfoX/Sxy family protein [Bacteroidota bacterium]MBL0072443.1 TfoX/Sxy family protein [Bacteroidota bacterium]MBP9082506.1 TfoX/Sxy family protein [Bacteroidia bacterium]